VVASERVESIEPLEKPVRSNSVARSAPGGMRVGVTDLLHHALPKLQLGLTRVRSRLPGTARPVRAV